MMSQDLWLSPDLRKKKMLTCLFEIQSLSERDVLEGFPWTGAGMRDSEKKHGPRWQKHGSKGMQKMLHSGR